MKTQTLILLFLALSLNAFAQFSLDSPKNKAIIEAYKAELKQRGITHAQSMAESDKAYERRRDSLRAIPRAPLTIEEMKQNPDFQRVIDFKLLEDTAALNALNNRTEEEKYIDELYAENFFKYGYSRDPYNTFVNVTYAGEFDEREYKRHDIHDKSNTTRGWIYVNDKGHYKLTFMTPRDVKRLFIDCYSPQQTAVFEKLKNFKFEFDGEVYTYDKFTSDSNSLKLVYETQVIRRDAVIEFDVDEPTEHYKLFFDFGFNLVEVVQQDIINKEWTTIWELPKEIHKLLEREEPASKRNRRYTETLSFTNSTLKRSLGNPYSHTSTKEYYLSNTADTLFNSKKVGESKKGNYIIVREKTLADLAEETAGLKISVRVIESSSNKNTTIYEILECTDERLKLKLEDGTTVVYEN